MSSLIYNTQSLRLTILVCVLALVGVGCSSDGNNSSPPQASSAEDARPNILLILADDMGYSDLGAFGSEIETPNLDELAASGMRLTNFHVHSTCSPTRAMMLSGVDAHKAGLGTMRGLETPEQQGQPGYETHLNFQIVTFANVLKDAGYHTYMSGKWHMGEAEEMLPHSRGFEESFALVPGSATHFSQHGALRDRAVAEYRDNGVSVQLPEQFYSTEFHTDKIIEQIDKHHGDGKPFMAYASYTAPHYPLQAPDEFIDKYQGVYDVGYDAIRSQRIEKLRQLGLIDASLEPAPQNEVWPAWDELTDQQRKVEAKRMQVYAAMVDALDHHVGRLIDHLEQIGELDNTLIVFLSDNGAEGTNPMDVLGNDEWVPATFDQSYDNMGKDQSFVWYGPGWAHVSATPYKLYKSYVTEGGLRSPTIVSMPGVVPPGTVSGAFASILDFYPTFLELAGAEYPSDNYQGREVHALQGESMLPLLSGETETVHDADYVVGLELFNRRALYQGDWKITWINKPWGKGDGLWALYNLKDDPAEQNDLADSHGEKLTEMLALWQQYVKDNGVLAVDKLDMRYSNTTDHYEWMHH